MSGAVARFIARRIVHTLALLFVATSLALVFVHLAGQGTFDPERDPVSLAAERARLAKEVGALTADIEKTGKKLANADFIARAPEEVVEENRERLADAEAAREKLQAALSRLGAVA